jgi:hypothetical protein
MFFLFKVISDAGRGSISHMRPNQRDMLAHTVDAFLIDMYGEVARFKRVGPNDKIYSCIPNDTIDYFNMWLDDRIAEGKNTKYCLEGYSYFFLLFLTLIRIVRFKSFS